MSDALVLAIVGAALTSLAFLGAFITEMLVEEARKGE